jgi:hypothetical protein
MWDRFAWDLRYLFGRRTDQWYLSLFDAAGDRLAGDISPSYFRLPESAVCSMKSLLPDVKIIILLRDPIDWSWSFARMDLISGWGATMTERCPHDIPKEEYFSFFNEIRGTYPTTEALEKWAQHFPSEQLFIGFYDRLCEDPRLFYDNICDFLGIDSAQAPETVLTRLSERKNEGKKIAMPDHLAVHLARIWLPEIEKLADAFHPYPQRWQKRCASILSSAPYQESRPHAKDRNGSVASEP